MSSQYTFGCLLEAPNALLDSWHCQPPTTPLYSTSESVQSYGYSIASESSQSSHFADFDYSLSSSTGFETACESDSDDNGKYSFDDANVAGYSVHTYSPLDYRYKEVVVETPVPEEVIVEEVAEPPQKVPKKAPKLKPAKFTTGPSRPPTRDELEQQRLKSQQKQQKREAKAQRYEAKKHLAVHAPEPYHVPYNQDGSVELDNVKVEPYSPEEILKKRLKSVSIGTWIGVSDGRNMRSYQVSGYTASSFRVDSVNRYNHKTIHYIPFTSQWKITGRLPEPEPNYGYHHNYNWYSPSEDPLPPAPEVVLKNKKFRKSQIGFNQSLYDSLPESVILAHHAPRKRPKTTYVGKPRERDSRVHMKRELTDEEKQELVIRQEKRIAHAKAKELEAEAALAQFLAKPKVKATPKPKAAPVQMPPREMETKVHVEVPAPVEMEEEEEIEIDEYGMPKRPDIMFTMETPLETPEFVLYEYEQARYSSSKQTEWTEADFDFVESTEEADAQSFDVRASDSRWTYDEEFQIYSYQFADDESDVEEEPGVDVALASVVEAKIALRRCNQPNFVMNPHKKETSIVEDECFHNKYCTLESM